MHFRLKTYPRRRTYSICSTWKYEEILQNDESWAIMTKIKNEIILNLINFMFVACFSEVISANV